MVQPIRAFPAPDTLCEACGYALKGLKADGGCPECGLLIAESSPALRTGPQWQTRPGPQAAFHIVIALILNPRYFFRRLRVDGPNTPPRLFMLIVSLFIGLLWFFADWIQPFGSTVGAVTEGSIVSLSVVLLSYIEAVGVTYFSRKRAWRIPMLLSERLVCYCSIAWVPAAGVMWLAVNLVSKGYIDHWIGSFLPTWEPWQSLALLVLIGAVAMMWFEVLVWLGVRQIKYANS